MKQLIEGLGGVDQVGGELACLGDVELCAIADPDRHGGVDGAVGVLPAVDRDVTVAEARPQQPPERWPVVSRPQSPTSMAWSGIGALGISEVVMVGTVEHRKPNVHN